MRYFVTIAGRTLAVELTGTGHVTVEGTPVSVDLATLRGTEVCHLLADGRSYRLVASPRDQAGLWEVHLDGRRYEARVVDERTRAIRAMTAHPEDAAGPRPVQAPMPGLIVRVEVSPGQLVHAGQGVLIMEAMKMENELKAEAAGVVSRILVEAGATVDRGATLVEFAPPTAVPTPPEE